MHTEASAAEPRYQSGGIVGTPEPFTLRPGERVHPVEAGEPGSRRFMAWTAVGRHPGTVALMRHLSFAHLPENLRVIVEPFAMTARVMLGAIETDSPELTTMLRKLIEAKDCAVRARVDQLDA